MSLSFYYGTMNSSKTANLIMKAHNYRQNGKKVVIVKPSLDKRAGDNNKAIESRAVPTIYADIILDQSINDINIPGLEEASHILVDEAQFLSVENVNNLRTLSTKVPVSCYGLRTDYRGVLFPGSRRLMEIADNIHEIKSVCTTCDRNAIVSCKFIVDNDTGVRKIIREGSSEPDMGSEEKYTQLCWSCWTSKVSL